MKELEMAVVPFCHLPTVFVLLQLKIFWIRNTYDWRVYRETVSLVYGACVLVFGGIGLVAAFITELKLSKK